MIEVYGYVPAWGLPDISPFVTKVIFYMTINKISFENQDLMKLETDSPNGKLPYILDTEFGTKKFGNILDDGLSETEQAVALAFDRLIGEHLYWSGVIEPRWRSDEGFETYTPDVVQGAEVGPELQAHLNKYRERILAQFNGQGMGRRDSAYFLGDKKYFFGDRVRSFDAALYAMLRHLVDQMQKWKGAGYIEGKKNLVKYMQRMRKDYIVGQFKYLTHLMLASY